MIELLEVFRFREVNERYCEIKHLRLTESKPNFKKAKLAGDVEQIQYWKLQDEFYKLVLNSTSGLIDMKHSWLYNPSMILKLRLMGQMILLRCIQDSIDCGYQVISTNTDGLTVRLLRSQLDAYQQMINNIGDEFGVEFEHETFKSIHYQNVNSYIAICENGIIKKKGSFLTKPELGLSVDNLVIAKLLQCYFVSGITPEEVLTNVETFKYDWDKKITQLGIFDFCASQKVDKSYEVVWNGQVQQRLNRYYVSKRGAYLYKTRNGRSAHMLKGSGVMIYNNHVNQPFRQYPIDIPYYINETNKIIFAITKANQFTLF